MGDSQQHKILIETLKYNVSKILDYDKESLLLANLHLVKFEGGVTFLHLAVLNDNVQAAGLLIELGSNVNAQTTRGNCPIHLASSEEMIAFLVSHRANLDIKNIYNFSAIETAFLSEKYNLVFYLLQEKADFECLRSWLDLPETADEDYIHGALSTFIRSEE